MKNRGNLYSFGMTMPNRSISSTAYKYGFNGMEKDDELKGSGNSYDFGARIYDSRLARFLSIDPKTTSLPKYSPYLFAGNKPINHIDLNGESEWQIALYYDANGNFVQSTTTLTKATSKDIKDIYRIQNFVINADGSLNARGATAVSNKAPMPEIRGDLMNVNLLPGDVFTLKDNGYWEGASAQDVKFKRKSSTRAQSGTQTINSATQWFNIVSC